MNVLETPRLTLRRLTLDDAEFILELVNEPSWLRFIGDRGIKTLEQSRAYLQTNVLEMYARCGHGLYAVERKQGGGAPVGICGLLKRASLADPDLGFAILERFQGNGYASEAAAAVLAYGRDCLGRIVAITAPGNAASAQLLAKLGMQFDRPLQLGPGETEVLLYS